MPGAVANPARGFAPDSFVWAIKRRTIFVHRLRRVVHKRARVFD
jgi:hypothetical protein